LVFDGYLTTDGVKQDAVFAEVGVQRSSKAFFMAQRYVQKRGSKKLAKDGEPIVAGETESLWKARK
jgi:hypothetical protein